MEAVWKSVAGRLRRQRGGRAKSRPMSRRAARLETLESRTLLAGDGLLISELMASNRGSLLDGSVPPDSPDWIEIHNPTSETISLGGWHLTDSAGDKTKWTFPEADLEAGEYLVVFASGNNVPDAAGNLHTNFQLDADGEYLALVEPDGETIAFEIAPEFPPQFSDVSYGLAASAADSTLLADGAAARAFVPTDDSLGLDWTQLAFDDSTWRAGTTGVGFETETGFEDEIGLDLETEMHGVNASAYLRVGFQVDDPSAVDRLSLNIQYDDGFVAYLNGEEIASRNARPTGQSPAQGLISYWDFDGNLNDQAARFANNSGVADDDFLVRSGGGARFVPGISGQAISLGSVGGEARSLSAAGTLDTQLGPIYTIETWIYPTALNTWSRLVLNWSGGQSYHFALKNGSRLSLFHNEAGGPNRNIDSDLGVVRLGSVAGWQHVVGVADGSQLRIYYNGEPVGSAPYDGTIQTVATGLGLGDLATGGSGTGLRYQGYLDDLAIWNVALTPEQIRSHFEAGGGGIGLREIGANTDLAFDARATRDRPDAEALLPVSIDLTAHRDLLQLGENILAIHGLNSSAGDSDFLIAPELQAASVSLDAEVRRYFTDPTPGEVNGTGSSDLGPIIRRATHAPAVPGDGDDIIVTATVEPTNAALGGVLLHYRVMFGAETTTAMFDDGLHGDGAADDGVFGATIPANASAPGEMVRWFITAEDDARNPSRWPLFEDPTGSPQYDGTAIADPATGSELPLFQWFVQNPAAAETGSGTRASVYYLDQFYDNVFVRIRGQTARSWPKKSYKFDFNRGNHFRFAEGLRRVEEINLNTTYTDKSYVRTILAYESFRDAGVSYSETFPLRIEQNGNFYSVAIFVEQVDTDFLRRNGLDENGALYKAKANGFTGSANSGFDKKTRRNENHADLQALINGLALSGAAEQTFLFDSVNLAAQINYMAANIIIQDIDRTVKNYYVYRDTAGTGEWFMLPWDEDLTFGPDALNTDVIDATDDASVDHSSHPFMGGTQFPFRGLRNMFLDAIYRNPITREMFLRRLRTLMDDLLQPPDTPVGELKFEGRIDALVEQMGPDVLLDRARWRGSAHFGGFELSFEGEINRLKSLYFARRRPHLYVSHNIDNPNNYALNVGIPNEQPDFSARAAEERKISFGTIEFAPASNDQDQEYIEIINANDVAIDISGWMLTGGVEHVFQPGMVIPARTTLYVTPSAKAFRARTVGPSGGQDLLVESGYRGHLGSHGETLQLLDTSGAEIASTSYEGQPSEAQQFLRVSELMFHPADDDAGRNGDDFEFIELVNTGAVLLNLAGVHFTSGVQYTFADVTLAASERLVLVKNVEAFNDRYDTAGMIVAGPFSSGTLDNGGEKVKLEDAQNGTILEFRYDDDWYKITDGIGFSISVIDVTAHFDTWGERATWRPSTELHGSPGQADAFSVPAPGAIVINEVLAHSDEDAGDWIELFNTTSAEINVGGWFLSDDNNETGRLDPLKYEIPSGTTIPAGGLATFTESQHFGEKFSLSELGDEVIVQAARDGTMLGFRAREDFGASDNGRTFGRFIKTTGGKDFVAMKDATFGAANSGPLVGPVVIHEIMYHPAEGEGSEFVELLNVSGAPVSLAGWRFSGIGYQFDEDVVIQPGELVLVVPLAPDDFRAVHNVPAAAELFGPYLGALSNAGESLRINKPGEPADDGFIPSIMVDRVSYDDRAPWPVEADGSGVALQRRQVAGYGNEPTNWTITLPGGTPGAFAIAPVVSEVLVAGSDWSRALLDRFSAAGSGEGGFSIPTGEAQLQTLAWTGIDQIIVRFSEPVDVGSGDLRVAGVNVHEYDVTDFSYDRSTSTAIWTLDRPIRADKLRIELSDGVRDESGFPLDGNWIDATSSFPSGDGVIDSDDAFRFRFNVLPGDAVAGGPGSDGAVDREDLLALIGGLGSNTTRPRYNARLDVNANGGIGVDDLRQVLLRAGRVLPDGEPGEIGSAAPQAAVDAVFERLGQAAAQAATTRWPRVRRARIVTSSSPTATESDHPLRRYQAATIDGAMDAESESTLARHASAFVRRRR